MEGKNSAAPCQTSCRRLWWEVILWRRGWGKGMSLNSGSLFSFIGTHHSESACQIWSF